MKTTIIVVLVCGLIYGAAFLLPADPAGEAREALKTINEYRSTENRVELTWDSELAELAISHSQAMKESGRFYHSAYPYIECILEGVSTGERIAELWERSPAHNYLIMGSDIKSAGVGISGSYATFMAR